MRMSENRAYNVKIQLSFITISYSFHFRVLIYSQDIKKSEVNTMKKNWKKYTDFIVKETEAVLNIDSPTGYTEEAAKWVKAEFEKLGYEAKLTNKGGVLVDLGGKDKENGLLLEAHVDTLGGMVAEVKGNGRLRLTNLGGMNPNNAETENVRVVTKGNGIYEGTFQLCNASIHVNGEPWTSVVRMIFAPSRRTISTSQSCQLSTSVASGLNAPFAPTTTALRSLTSVSYPLDMP